MSTDTHSGGTNPAASPLDSFSTCHAGILDQLEALAGLPALLGRQAGEAPQVAADVVSFFREVVFSHHQEEEYELFTAVLASAESGPEQERVRTMVDRLTREHREVEAAYGRLASGLKAVARGQPASLDAAAVSALAQRYQGHAQFEEEVFLPLAQQILGRNGEHLAALGLALHLRREMPSLMDRFGSQI